MITKIAFSLSATLVLTAVSAAQMSYSASTTRPDANGQRISTITMRPSDMLGFPVTDAPYSATKFIEHRQLLADGTHIAQRPRVTRMWRDSQGRTRTELPAFAGLLGDADPAPAEVIIEIYDPIARYRYVIDEQNQIVHRIILEFAFMSGNDMASGLDNWRLGTPAANAARLVPHRAPLGSQSREHSNIERASEDLGAQQIEGLLTSGIRITTTMPVGTVGNDAPLVIVTEEWRSPDLKMDILTKTTDPRSGEQVVRLANISRNEPDPALFQPPPGYKIIDEKGEFKITFTDPR